MRLLLFITAWDACPMHLLQCVVCATREDTSGDINDVTTSNYVDSILMYIASTRTTPSEHHCSVHDPRSNYDDFVAYTRSLSFVIYDYIFSADRQCYHTSTALTISSNNNTQGAALHVYSVDSLSLHPTALYCIAVLLVFCSRITHYN